MPHRTGLLRVLVVAAVGVLLTGCFTLKPDPTADHGTLPPTMAWPDDAGQTPKLDQPR